MSDSAKSLRSVVRYGARFAVCALRTPRRALLVGRMVVAVTAVSVGAKLFPLPSLMWAMKPLRTRRAAGAEREAVQAELARLLDELLAADLFVFEPKCWKRAPVLYRFLALHGVESRVVFGMRREEGGGVAGHAWVESGGRPVLEACPPDYSVTYVFPHEAGAAGGGRAPRRRSVQQG